MLPLDGFGARLDACRLEALAQYGRDATRWKSSAAHAATATLLDRALRARELRLTRNHLKRLQVRHRSRANRRVRSAAALVMAPRWVVTRVMSWRWWGAVVVGRFGGGPLRWLVVGRSDARARRMV